MSLLADRVKDTTATTGTGTITLANSAPTGYRTFGQAVTDGHLTSGGTVNYCIEDSATGAWEVGRGVYTVAGQTLTRPTILASSNGGAAVSFVAGSKNVFITAPASVVESAVDVQKFIASGTWTKPPGAKWATAIFWGGGAGGGAGRRGAAASGRGGGAGGGGGAKVTRSFDASLLGATETVTVGAGGAGGAAQTADSTNGATGSAGGQSYFTTLGLSSGLSNPGTGGTATTAAGGTASASWFESVAQASGGVGGAGGTGVGGVGVTSQARPSGGGAGGGITSGDVVSAGGDGGRVDFMFTAILAEVAGGAAGAAGANGSAGNNLGAGYSGGSGGGGGGSSKTAIAGTGGSGGIPGGGGGGGGASLNGFNSGAGGAGGRGEVWVITYL